MCLCCQKLILHCYSIIHCIVVKDEIQIHVYKINKESVTHLVRLFPSLEKSSVHNSKLRCTNVKILVHSVHEIHGF